MLKLITTIVFALAVVVMFATECYATSVPLEPNVDWTIKTSSGNYGLLSYEGSISYLCWGSKELRIPLHPWVVGTIGIALVLLVCFAVASLGRIRRPQPRG